MYPNNRFYSNKVWFWVGVVLLLFLVALVALSSCYTNGSFIDFLFQKDSTESAHPPPDASSAMTQLVIKSDNGSVPDPYYYSSELTLKANGSAYLKVFYGRGSSKKTVLSESKSVNTTQLARLVARLETYRSLTPAGPFVGGEQKYIILQEADSIKNIAVYPADEVGIQLYKEFLALYDPGLENRLKTFPENN